MPSEPEEKNWWTTLPGVLTALASLLGAVTALIVALNTAGLLNRPAPTGVGSSIARVPEPQRPATNTVAPTAPEPVPSTTTVVPPKPEEPTPAALEFSTYHNLKYGYTVIYPKALLFPEKEDPAYGRVFKSLDGKVTLNVMAGDNPKGEITAASGYKDMTEVLTKHSPVTILEQRLESNGFEFKTKNGRRIGHSKTVVTASYFRMLSMEYDDSEGAVYDPVWTRIATQFERF